jgi:hypothetical protein
MPIEGATEPKLCPYDQILFKEFPLENGSWSLEFTGC